MSLEEEDKLFNLGFVGLRAIWSSQSITLFFGSVSPFNFEDINKSCLRLQKTTIRLVLPSNLERSLVLRRSQFRRLLHQSAVAISGIPSLFSSDFDTAFVFKNKEQAEAFITEFADELHNPKVLDCP
jgi:hypothetical protein